MIFQLSKFGFVQGLGIWTQACQYSEEGSMGPVIRAGDTHQRAGHFKVFWIYGIDRSEIQLETNQDCM